MSARGPTPAPGERPALSDAEAKVRAAYDTVAAAYDARIGDELTAKAFDRAMLGLVAELADRGILADVGCGPGHVTRFLSDRHGRLVGIDLSPEMVAIARSRHPTGAYVGASMLALPVREGALAGAVVMYSIIHFADDARTAAIRELARAIAPGGWILVAFHVESAESAMGGVTHATEFLGEPVDLEMHYLDPQAVAADLEAAGFSVAATTTREAIPGAEYPSRRCYLLGERGLA